MTGAMTYEGVNQVDESGNSLVYAMRRAPVYGCGAPARKTGQTGGDGIIPVQMKRLAPTALVLIAFLLHQDQWFWGESRPLVLGVLPPGLWYHGLYAIGCAGLMWYLTRAIWPAHLDRD
jgi:hypothetical protein